MQGVGHAAHPIREQQMERLTEQRHDPRDTSFTERHEIHYTVKKEKKFKAFDKLGKLENLEEKIGCPLEVRCKLCDGTIIYDEDGKSMGIEHIGEHDFYAVPTERPYTPRLMYMKGYKKSWWLKADRSE